MEHPKSSRKAKKGTATVTNNTHMNLNNITPLTDNQRLFFENFYKHDVLSLRGFPGTGKTFIALYKSLSELLNNQYHNINIIRSAVSSRELGFMPGNLKEKMSVFESPYISIINELYGRGDAYDILRNKKILNFSSSSFLRGTTFSNSIVIVDEAQNMSYQELYTIFTRMGKDCKIVICGDERQDDLTSERYKVESGYSQILDILSQIKSVYSVNMTPDDIVRSGFVKDFILASQNALVQPDDGLKVFLGGKSA